MIAREARLMLAAAGFLTRLPVGQYQEGSSARYFSLVGAAVGALGAAVTVAAAALLPQLLAVILGVVATVLVTGALHEDGLADSCDGFGGGSTREDVLRIMQDPRIGAFGALGLMLVLALKIASLAHLPVAALPFALIGGHAFSRALCVALMAFGRYARPEGGKSRGVAEGVRPVDAAIAIFIGCVPLVLFLPAIGTMLVVAAALHVYFRARIGGYTGDALGALQQLTETACYVMLVAVL